MADWQVEVGDCIEVLSTLPDACVDAIVTDPPYGMSADPDIEEVLRHWLAGDRYEHGGGGFMGKTWDSFVPGPEYWRECFRVLKPGGHLLAFAASRTYDLMAIAIRFAGFPVRDMIGWWYGTGFPKSLNVGEGRGTALKPAQEPVCVARKPLDGTVAANVAQWGTGALNIDGCRIATDEKITTHSRSGNAVVLFGADKQQETHQSEGQALGRWPANVILDEDAAAELDAQSGPTGARAPVKGTEPSAAVEDGAITNPRARVPGAFHADKGGASRFFYVAKASRAERDAGCAHLPARSGGEATDREDGSDGLKSPRAGAGRTGGARNHHPTVKPIALMRYLVRLVTPPGGLILDPFCGSGTTGMAAVLEGLSFVGIDMSVEYCEIARARIQHVQENPGKYKE